MIQSSELLALLCPPFSPIAATAPAYAATIPCASPMLPATLSVQATMGFYLPSIPHPPPSFPYNLRNTPPTN